MKGFYHWLLLCIFFCGNTVRMSAQMDTSATEQPVQVSDSIMEAKDLSPLPMRPTAYAITNALYGYPFLGGWGGMPLHEGLNASFGMDVTAAFGKYAPKGAGFGQTAALTYVKPLNKRFSFLVGLDVRHLHWGGYDHTAVGVNASLAYAVNPRFNLYAYVYKRLTPAPQMVNTAYLWDNTMARERLGIAADYKVSKSVTLGLSFEMVHQDAAWPLWGNNTLLRPYDGLYW